VKHAHWKHCYTVHIVNVLTRDSADRIRRSSKRLKWRQNNIPVCVHQPVCTCTVTVPRSASVIQPHETRLHDSEHIRSLFCGLSPHRLMYSGIHRWVCLNVCGFYIPSYHVVYNIYLHTKMEPSTLLDVSKQSFSAICGHQHVIWFKISVLLRDVYPFKSPWKV
jgi:hypothetical protein